MSWIVITWYLAVTSIDAACQAHIFRARLGLLVWTKARENNTCFCGRGRGNALLRLSSHGQTARALGDDVIARDTGEQLGRQLQQFDFVMLNLSRACRQDTALAVSSGQLSDWLLLSV